MTVLKNPRHEKFAAAVALGVSQAEAYRKAGFRGDRAAASRLAEKVNISQRIVELKNEAATQCGIDRQKFSARLAECFNGKVTMRLDQLKAGEMLAKACGWNEPEKIEVSGQQDVIIRIGGVDI